MVQKSQNSFIQIKIKVVTLHFPNIFWIMDYRGLFLHFHTNPVGLQHPLLY